MFEKNSMCRTNAGVHIACGRKSCAQAMSRANFVYDNIINVRGINTEF